jgi:hypothetical protein
LNLAGIFLIFPDEFLCSSFFPNYLLISSRPARYAGLISISDIVPTFCVSFQRAYPSLAPVRFSLKDVPAGV